MVTRHYRSLSLSSASICGTFGRAKSPWPTPHPLTAGKSRLVFGTGFPFDELMSLATNLESVRERIAAACARLGRDPAMITLLAVTKGQPPAVVREAADLG